jgi:type IV secretory pathway ATPase VirB11/archaellum biosynthesis ATPase
MVTIETDDELGEIGPANRASLLYDEAQVSSDEAVRIALRLSPKEIVVQEIRGAEAYSMLRALRSGHNGLTSFHADVGEEYTALGMMVRHHPAGREIPEERLMEMVSTAFDIIAHCEYSEEDGWKVSALKMWAAEQEMA